MPVIDDPRDTGQAVAIGLNTGAMPPAAPPDPRPSLLDTLAAASRQATLAGSAYERFLGNPDPDGDYVPDGWDPLDHVRGYEDFADELVDARTPSELEGKKRRIRGEQQDRDVLRRAGLGGPVAEIGLNLVDPSFLVAIAVPELAMAKAGRVGRAAQAALEGAATAGVYETGMQGLQETRTGTESVFSVAAGTLLGGVLGSLTRRVPAPELAAAQEAIRSEAGAAAVRRPTTLEAETLAGGGDTFARAMGKVPLSETDAQVILRAESVEARTALQELAEVPGEFRKNVDGIASPTAVESILVRHEGAVADFATEMKKAWRAYKQRTPDPDEPRLNRSQFEEAVASAARRGDRDLAPEVTRMAQRLRERVFDPLKRDAQKLGLLPPDSEIDLFAESYFRRMYDRDKIRARRGQWDELLVEHFRAKGMPRAEAQAAADDITRRILGADVGVANFNLRTSVQTAGPLQERVLDIRDELIEPFLVNDPLKVAGAYVRELAPQVEFAKRFGDKDAKELFQRVSDEYAILRTRAGGDATRVNALTDEEQRVTEAMKRIRDRLLGVAGRLGPDAGLGQRRAAEILRGWRNLVAAARLGGTALTGGAADLSRIVAQYGFAPTMGRLTKLIASPAFRELSKAHARRLGIATEVALAKRVQVASDGAITEGWTQKLAELTFQASGLNHVTDLWRTLAATLIEDRIVRAALDTANGRLVSKATRSHLAALGLDEDALRRIAAEVQREGATLEGLHTSGSMTWRDSELALRYDAAIIKEARVAVMQPGAADRVWWADKEIGKTFGQLKAFSLSAPLRLTLTPVQMIGQGRYVAAARFAGMMMAGGYLVHALRQLAAGKEPVTDPTAAAGEAFVESGLGGILPDMVSPIGRRFGLFGESARFSDRNVTSAYGGPAVGTLTDAYDVLFNRTQNGLSARDLQALRRLLPLQNLWWLRRAINAAEGEAAEAMNLEGATEQSFGERMLETQPLPAATARGGTGTGLVTR